MSREQWTNGVNTTLTSTITAGSTSIKVASVATLTSDGYARFQIGSEVIGVGLNGTATWSTQVDRGLEGTVAAGHTSSEGVYQRLTAGALDHTLAVLLSSALVGSARDLNFVSDSTGGALAVTLTTGPLSTGQINVSLPVYYSTAPTVVFSSAAAPGSTGVILRSDATLALFNAVAPTTQAFGDAASSGTAAFAARQDHKHGWPALSSGAITFSTAASAGSTGSPLRGDAAIAAFDGVAPTTWAFGAASASGSAAFAARRDHVHGAPTTTEASRQSFSNGTASNPPSNAQLITLFGPSSSLSGFVGVLNTSGGSTAVWLIMADGYTTSWWYAAGTKAV